MNATLLTSALRAITVLALAASAASAQVLAPNLFVDGHDIDLSDGLCDADPFTPGSQCTLRAAFQHAQAVGGSWTIILGAGTYPLTRIGTDAASAAGDLDVFNIASLTVVGAGAATVIDAGPLAAGGGPDRVLELVASLPPNVTVELRDLTLRGGRAGGFGGGGILHEGGRLVLHNVHFFDCQAASSTGNGGGGLRTNGEVVAVGGSFQACVAGAPLSSGGGVLAKSGALVSFAGTSFVQNQAGNRGGGLRVESGASATVAGGSFGNCGAPSGAGISVAGAATVTALFLGNTATGAGGGAGVDAGGFLELVQSVLDNNTAQSGGGVNVAGAGFLVARDTTFRSNRASFFGGGVSNGGLLELERCTLAANEASGAGGGALYHLSAQFPPVRISLCTLSGNRAPSGSGGGIHAAGAAPIEISATTIVLNSALQGGAGLHTEPGFGVPPLVRGSLLFDNRDLNGLRRNAGGIPPAPAGPNLDSDGTCLFGDPCLSGTPFVPLDARLGPLGFYGGPTETHELLACSPAIDAGVCDTVAGLVLPSDQRLFPRFANCDLGSFEAQPGVSSWEIVPFCFGTALSCPCGVGGAPGHGCPNSVQPAGGLLSGSGIARVSCDTLVLTASSITNSSALLFQGTAPVNGGLGVVFGDGLRCAGGTVIRLGTLLASSGTASWPPAGGLPLSTGGVVPAVGGDRYYQVWYRNAAVFCTSATFNLTNGVRVTWCP
ncbi:MAG: hypothetical protein JNK02_00870 [Planctomycetes bacterium]|nr:hypothetical protein [Planctomycetota bacterium]